MKKFRILIVDDSGRYRTLLKKTLQVSFPTIPIDEAANGGEASQKVDAFLPDLIFMDIRLREENGLELTKKIKATHPNITILVVTGYDIPEYREAASQYGADRFLVKNSLNYMELEELVKNLCFYYWLKKRIGKTRALGVANTIENIILIFERVAIPYSNRDGTPNKER